MLRRCPRIPPPEPWPIDAEAFNAFEAAGWDKKAATYDRFFGQLTGRLVDPLLDAAGVRWANTGACQAEGPRDRWRTALAQDSRRAERSPNGRGRAHRRRRQCHLVHGIPAGLGWIDLPVFDDGGLPVHDRGVVAAEPGLYFVGLPFLFALTSSLVGGIGGTRSTSPNIPCSTATATSMIKTAANRCVRCLGADLIIEVPRKWVAASTTVAVSLNHAADLARPRAS
jgi:hypothetical protein